MQSFNVAGSDTSKSKVTIKGTDFLTLLFRVTACLPITIQNEIRFLETSVIAHLHL